MSDLTKQLGLALAGVNSKRSTPEELLQETIDIANISRDAGFGYFVMGQHFLMNPLQYLHPIPALARLANETGDMKLVIGIMLLSLVNPVDAADQLATVDVISGGRMVLGLGMGYRDEEMQAFGVERKERSPRMLEALEVVRKLWKGGPIDHEGRFFTVKAEGSSLPRKELPIWMAAMAPKTLNRAADMGVSPYIGPAAPISTVSEWMPEYRERVGDPNATLPIRRDVFIVRDRSKAWDMAESFVAEKYEMYRKQGFDTTLGDKGLREAISERVIVGDIEECSDKLAQYFEMGAGPIILRCQWPSLETSETQRMVEDIALAADRIRK